MALFDYTIITDQTTVHQNLPQQVLKFKQTAYRRPISPTQQHAFSELQRWVEQQQRPLIVDSGCGYGMSTAWLAAKYPTHSIIGIDKSLHRLTKNSQQQHPNQYFVRAQLEDIWRLLANQGWPIEQHYLLYPNPWPKAKHVSRRWHGHPIFPTLINLAPTTLIRSNWLLYLEEFALAANLHDKLTSPISAYQAASPMTHFEQKYWQAQVITYQLTILPEANKASNNVSAANL